MIVRIKDNYMKQSDLKYSCLIAVLYFGMNVNAQTTPRDTVAKEQKIEEVVMIGYGSRKKVDNTAAISSINAEEVSKTKVLNPTQAIQGKAAGVQVSASDLPGSTPSIVIRGLGTALGGREPLYVVDGMMVGGISNINTNDILTYDVLKDASALAIYGNRGANGVVIITTKSGRGKGISVEYDGFIGVRTPLKKVKMAGSNLFSYYTNTALGTTKFSQDQPVNTDWFDEITRVGIYNQHNVSVSGSSENAKYFFSASNYDEKSILKGTDYNRTTVRTNNEFKIAKGVVLTQTLSVAFFNVTPKPLSAFTAAYKQSPLVPVYFGTGQYGVSFVGANGFASTSGSSFNNVGNPVAQLNFNNQRNNNFQLQGSVKLDVDIFKGLKYTGQFSGQYNNAKSYNYTPNRQIWLANDPTRTLAQYNSSDPINTLTNNRSNDFNYAITNYLTYNKKLGVHDIEATIGTELTVFTGAESVAYTRNNVLENSNYWNLDGTNYAGNNLATLNSVKANDARTLSYFGRAQYKLLNRYLLTATVRRDGSSQFTEDKRWGTFPSFGAGWVISEEDFLKDVSFLNLLKLRGGWGKLGNQNVPLNFLPFATGQNYNYYFNGIANNGGTTLVRYFDPNLSWEIVKGSNVGLDFEMLDRRLTGTIDLYKKVTDNLILQATPISTTGLEEAGYSHLGQVTNKGVEISLGWGDRIGQDFSYSVNANYSFNKNTLDKLNDENVNDINGGSLGNGQWTKLLSEKTLGQPLGSFYLWEVAGYDANGNFTYVDTDGDGKTGAADADDRKFFGSYIPKSTLGININLRYKNVDLSVNGYGAFGFKVYNGKKAQRFSGENIEYDVASNFWTPNNTSAGNPAPFNAVPIASNYYLESGDFFRVNNITLGYNIDTKLKSIKTIRLYVNAINPFISQKFSGYTSELPGDNDPYGSAGIELDAYPTVRSFVFGVNVKF